MLFEYFEVVATTKVAAAVQLFTAFQYSDSTMATLLLKFLLWIVKILHLPIICNNQIER